MLEIIDEQENIIGLAPRSEIHTKGLLHREIHVWIITSDNKIVFQKRSSTKDLAPNLLDASAGGHVDIGETPLSAALRELEEESGIRVKASEINFLYKKIKKSFDSKTETCNNALRYIYSYRYNGKLSDLKLEMGESDGFVSYSISELEQLSEEEKKKFMPLVVSDEYIEIYRNILARYKKRKYYFTEYNPAWVDDFEKIKNLIKDIWQDALAIEHIGSTSIVGMSAKPVIDVLVVVDEMKSFEKEIQKMKSLDFMFLKDYVSPNTLNFYQVGSLGQKINNIHVCEKDSPDTKRYISMRDYFRAYPEVAKEYSLLKEKNNKKYPDDYILYRQAKAEFLSEIKERAYKEFNR